MSTVTNNDGMTILEQHILGVVVYFDIFSYPLTSMEIFRYGMFPEKVSLRDVMEECNRLYEAGQLDCRHGFFTLSNRFNQVAIRHRRYIISLKKYAIARRAARWLRWVPGIRMIAVCNNLGIRNTREESDIDFFITTRAGRLWMVRLGAIMLTSLLHIRLAGSVKADKVCLSFYCQSDTSLQSVQLSEGDPYLTWWLATMRPLYNQEAYAHFININSWFQNQLPRWRPAISVHRYIVTQKYEVVWRRLWEQLLNNSFGAWLEATVHHWQKRRLVAAITDLANAESTSVVINESMLKLHTNDRRELYRDLWRQRCAQQAIDIKNICH